MAEFEVLFDGGSFFEGPRWRDGRWWVSDFYRHQIATYDTDGTETVQHRLETQPSGLGWTSDGALIVSSMTDRTVRREVDGDLRVFADLSELAGGHLNDLVVDANDHVFVGEFGFDLMGGGAVRRASVFRVDPDGSVTVAADDLAFPNGMVITPDGSTLIVGETMGNRYSAFALAEDGTLSDRREWARFGDVPESDDLAVLLGTPGVAPDGCSLDADGNLWVADALNARAILVAPGGEILRELRVPGGLGVFACQLGGDDGRTLLLCAAPDFLEHNRAAAREAVLFTTVVDTPHAGLP